MTSRKLILSRSLWTATWDGLKQRGDGKRESACVWVGTREESVERALHTIFLDDLPGTKGRPLQHRTSREAVVALLSQARELGMVIVCDLHTHPASWVDLSFVDQAHPIEYRVGLLALVLPDFATGSPDLTSTGVHEYAGEGRWRTMHGDDAARRVCIVDGGDDE